MPISVMKTNIICIKFKISEKINNVSYIKNTNKGKDDNKIKGALDYYQNIIPKLYRGRKKITGFINSIKSNLKQVI